MSIPHALLALSILFFAGTACADRSPQLDDRTGHVQWAILPLERAADFGWKPEACWRPSKRAVHQALAGLRAYLDAQREIELAEGEGDAHIWHEMVYGVLEKLPAYRCQVLGVEEEGRRLIYFNFVHFLALEPHPDDAPDGTVDWRTTPHVVDGGGDHYWQVFYDPAKKTFLEMGINGES